MTMKWERPQKGTDEPYVKCKMQILFIYTGHELSLALSTCQFTGMPLKQRKYRSLHGKCARTVFMHELLASEFSDTKTTSA